jgi:glycosyltransferase involved in cell wall biosynthesis
MYKHQWVVVRAISILRKRGYNIKLTLAGGGSGHAQQLLDNEIAVTDPDRIFINQIGFVPHEDLPSLLADNHVFVFASSCENLPVTLLEAMAVGLPIACSNRGPMPEVLGNGGVYFNPENADSIVDAIERIISDSTLRTNITKEAEAISEKYSWSRCAEETWKFIAETYRRVRS